MSEKSEVLKKALAAVKEDPALQLALLKVSQYSDFLSTVANDNQTVLERLIAIIRECCTEGEKLGISRATIRQMVEEAPEPEPEPLNNPFAPKKDEPTESGQNLT